MLFFQLFNDTHRENCALLNLAQEIIEVEAWLFVTFLLCLHNQLIVTNLRLQMFEKWMVASFSISTGFMGKFELVFVLTQENAVS